MTTELVEFGAIAGADELEAVEFPDADPRAGAGFALAGSTNAPVPQGIGSFVPG
jgi:hypothetical protein